MNPKLRAEKILEVVKSREMDSPSSLVDIIAMMDVKNSLVLTHSELEEGLRDLVAQGKLVEVAKHRFYIRNEGDKLSSFSGLLKIDYDIATSEYHKWFAEAEKRDLEGIMLSSEKEARLQWVVERMKDEWNRK